MNTRNLIEYLDDKFFSKCVDGIVNDDLEEYMLSGDLYVDDEWFLDEE